MKRRQRPRSEYMSRHRVVGMCMSTCAVGGCTDDSVGGEMGELHVEQKSVADEGVCT